MKELSEKEIENSILEFLAFQNINAWKNNSTGIYDPRVKRFRKKTKYDRIGVSDILGILPDGLFLAIEVKKNEKEKLRPSQVEFIEQINSSGGIGFVAFSLECVIMNLKEYLTFH